VKPSNDNHFLAKREAQFPWEQRPYGEDRWAAEQEMREHYAKLNFAAPKMSWASSPAALWSAISMLKTFPHKHAMIDTLIPARGLVSVEGEAKRTMLAAILDDALLTSMGAPVAPLLRWELWPGGVHQAIHDADRLITRAARASDALSRSKNPAGWSDACLYPLLHPAGMGPLAANAFCVLPYLRVCWLCLPPLCVKTDPHGHLHCEDGPAIRWADGFELHCVYTPPPTEAEQRERLEAELGRVNPENETVKALNGALAGLKKKRLEEQ
jgi:hypothetical protein